MTVLRALAAEKRAITSLPWGDWGEGGSTSWVGANVTTTNATQLLTVYGCVRLIADAIATLPLDVYRDVDGEQQEVAAPRWLVQPTPDLDLVAWLTQILTSLLLDGNAYIWLEREGLSIKQAVPLDPTKVHVRRDKGAKRFVVGGAVYTPFEIQHIPGLMFPGSDKGLSPVEAARQSIGMGMSAQEYGARFFSQGATQTGVIEVPGDMPSDGVGSAENLANQWARRHSGKNKAHLPGVLVGGATWKSTGVTNEQAQFLETRRYTAAEIAGQMFLIDPTDLGIGVEGQSITYANLEQRNLRRVQVTFLPWIVRLEHALSAILARPRFVKLNVDGLLRADLKTRYESYAIGITNDFLMRSEARDIEDLPPIDGIDDRPLPKASNGGGNAPAAA